MYIVSVSRKKKDAIKKISFNEIRNFFFENCYKYIRFSRKNSFLFNETFEKKIYYCLQFN